MTGAAGRAELMVAADMPLWEIARMPRSRKSRESNAVARATASPKGMGGSAPCLRSKPPKAPCSHRYASACMAMRFIISTASTG